MLNTYLSQVQRLLQNPPAPNVLYATVDLIDHINEARVQVAGEGVCVPQMGTMATVAGSAGPYPFSSIAFSAAPSVSGIQGPLSIRTIWFALGLGQRWMEPRPWPWFSLYQLNDVAPNQGPPVVWTLYGQGTNGSIYVNYSDQIYTLNVDTICYPIPLVDDTTAEAIPPLWQTAVQYYAAYKALLSSQTSARNAEADKMLERYENFVTRARKFTTPDVLPLVYPQNPSPVRANQLGQSQQAGG